MEMLAQRILNLSDSQTLEMAQKSRDLKAKGIDIINLSIGEPDFNTPDLIKEAGKKAIDDNYSHYSPVPGYESLRKAIAAKLLRDNQLVYKPCEIIVSNGAKQSLANVILCLINAGDEVIIPAPYWVSYIEQVKLADGVPVILDTFIKNDFKITPGQLEEAITPRTKAIFLNSPSNPTGSVYSESELKALAEILRKYPQLFIISDEIYEHINFVGNHFSIAQCEGMKERTALINGVSKGYAMTRWRIGYLAAPEWLVKACNKLQGQTTSGPSSISQVAAEVALNRGSDSTQRMNEAFKKRRDLVMKLLSGIHGLIMNEPQGAFYIFPNIEHFLNRSFNGRIIENDDQLSIYLLEEAHVAIVPGSAFGNPRCIRISYAASEKELTDAIDRIANALMKLS